MNLLFDAPLIDGLSYEDALVSIDEERDLIDRLQALELAPFRFHGWTGNRKTKSFGWRYDFDDASLTPAEPIPEWLRPLRAKAARFAGTAPGAFVHVLLARYDPGAGIGWHRDRPQFEQVVGVSLGSAAMLRFRQRTDGGFRRANVRLEPRSAYLLSGDVRTNGNTALRPATGCGSRSPSGRCRKKAAAPPICCREQFQRRNGLDGMRRSLLLFVLTLAACSKGPQADLQYIAEARSLAAEWALVNEQAAEGKLTPAYVSAMRASLQKQAKAASQALTQHDAPYAREMQAIAAEPENAAPRELRAHSDKLKQIENSLESA